jgi:hypothetical protein
MSPQALGSGRFSPDDRRFATIAYVVGPDDYMLYIDDLVSKHREAVAFRIHVRGTGGNEVLWLDPTSFVVSGSVTGEIAGDLWRVRMDATGKLVGPPQILWRSKRDTVLVPQDAQSGKLLIERVAVAMQNTLIDGESRTTLPGSAAHVRPVAVDGAHRRVLGTIDVTETRWAWMSLDGSRAAVARSHRGSALAKRAGTDPASVAAT